MFGHLYNIMHERVNQIQRNEKSNQIDAILRESWGPNLIWLQDFLIANLIPEENECEMGQNILEWIKQICGRQPLKYLKWYGRLKQRTSNQNF